MTIYKAELPAATRMEIIEALREQGAVRLVFEIEGASRRQVIRDLAAEYAWLGFDAEWWDRRLSGRQRRKDGAL